MACQAPSCAAVGSAKAPVNHARVGSENRSRAGTAPVSTGGRHSADLRTAAPVPDVLCGTLTAMRRSLYEAEHEDFRETVRAWAENNVVPFHDQWERDGIVPREVWTSAGAQGLLGTDMEERYGGGGVRDFRYQAVLDEELMRIGATGLGFGLHNDVAGPYLRDLGTEEQKQRWLPGFCSGELITAIAMTEPGAGSDLQGIQTTARKDGDGWVLNGSKTFITNGINAELFFDDVRVPAENLLGTVSGGFIHLMENLPQERLSIAVGAVAACERMLV